MLTLFHAPQSRSSRIVSLIDEMGIQDRVRIVPTDIPRMDGSGGADPANPHPEGKVPALLHDQTLVTESAAVIHYLTQLFPDTGMAPQPGDPRYGAYLTWLYWYGNVMEPVITFALFTSIFTMENAVNSLRVNCIDGITANSDRTRDMVLNSLGIVTVLTGAHPEPVTAFFVVLLVPVFFLPLRSFAAAYHEQLGARGAAADLAPLLNQPEETGLLLEEVPPKVTITFQERHSYLVAVPADRSGPVRQTVDKQLFVSPFMDMGLTYDFTVQPPGEAVSIVVAVRRRHRPGPARQPQRQPAQEGMWGHRVHDRAARLGEAQPDPAVEPAHEVVGEARQVVDQHLRGALVEGVLERGHVAHAFGMRLIAHQVVPRFGQVPNQGVIAKPLELVQKQACLVSDYLWSERSTPLVVE